MSEVMIDLDRGTMVPVLPPAIGSGWVSWNSDGSRMVFRRFNQLCSMSTSGRADGAPVPYSGATDYPSAAGPDPDGAMIARFHPQTSGEISLLSISGSATPPPLLVGRGYQ